MGMPVFLSLTSASIKTTRVRILIVSAISWARIAGADSRPSNKTMANRIDRLVDCVLLIDFSSGYARLRRAIQPGQHARRAYRDLWIAGSCFIGQRFAHFVRTL